MPDNQEGMAGGREVWIYMTRWLWDKTRGDQHLCVCDECWEAYRYGSR